MKFFLDPRGNSRLFRAALIAAGIAATSLTAWQAKAALPRWMQDVVGSSAIEAALYRAMEIPGVKALYPRPPKEAEEQLSGLIGKGSRQADLYSLRAMEEEQALNFKAAEGDWKAYASLAEDPVGAKLELADYYHRRLQVNDEVATLLKVGEAPAQPREQYTPAATQRSWKAFERLLLLAADQALDDETVERCYATWIARYPQQPSLYARQFRWLLDSGKDTKKFGLANDLVVEYRRAFPQDPVFPLKATALLELRRGGPQSIEKALGIYDAGFEPQWPAELVESYYALLAQTHRQRQFLAEARERLAANPDDLIAMARLFYYWQQQGNLESARQVVEAYRLSKERREAKWSAQELDTRASLLEAIHAYPEAARYDFALYHANGSLASGASAQAKGLSGVIRILLNAPEQPVELGAGNLSMYRDVATLDQGPGYWNGILSLWLNSDTPQQSYNQEEQRAQPYFHRAKAAALLAVLDKNYPKAPARRELHKELIEVFAGYGESGLVLKAGNNFLNEFALPEDETDRVVVAMSMADSYAQQNNAKGEFELYDRMLTELGARTAGMPLTAAHASNQEPAARESDATQSTQEGSDQSSDEGSDAAKRAEKNRAFEVSAGSPAGVVVLGSQEYQQVLERYLGRLAATSRLPEALGVLRKELDRNPNDALLYERLASFLQQNNLSAQQEEVYNQAIQKFQDKGWYDKLARLYLREKKREAFADLTRQVTGIFAGTELESYFAVVNRGSPQLFLQLNLYAHQRFPYDELFVSNLLAAYHSKTTYDDVAWEELLREHWNDSDALRQEFFGALSRKGRLDAELAQLNALASDPGAQKANPAATRELLEIAIWQSHFETSAPLLGTLAEAYPADEEIGTRASSVFRSLAYYDTAQTARAVAVEKNLLAYKPADMDRLARIGDIFADSGADTTTGRENIEAAAPYWRRMPAIHPGSPDGYLQTATIFWDYFQFDDALKAIREARAKFNQPVLYGYEAGAIYEGKRDLTSAIREYTAAACAGDGRNRTDATERLMQLAQRKATLKMVDDATVKVAQSSGNIAALELREQILEVLKRSVEIGPLLDAALNRATTLDQVQAIGSQLRAHSLAKLYELALQREIALATDPVQKIELSYDLARAYEGRKDLEDASRLIEQVYDENPKLLGVVRSTTDFYWRNKQAPKAIATLTAAAQAAKPTQPALSRKFIAEAADKANASASYAQARGLMAPLIDPTTAEAGGYDAYDAQSIAIVADSYARAGNDPGLKQFYLDELTSIRSTLSTMTTDERKAKTVLLRRGLIPALTHTKDYAGAVEQYIAILSAYPEDEGTAQDAALYALRYSRQQQLIEFLDGTVKASPRDSRFAIVLATVQTTFGDLPAAVNAYARAIAIRADRLDLYEAKADLEERLLRLDDACREYERLYVLSYRNPQWMINVARLRARQGRRDDAIAALQRAWIEGHRATSLDYFHVAEQLEAWNMLGDSLHFAELGVKAEGKNLLGGSEAAERNGDDPQGAEIYSRLLTRTRQVPKAFVVLDAAREDANQSTLSPSVIVEQTEKHGLASVTNEEWRKRYIEQRQQTAAQRYRSALLQIGKTAGTYFTPEEKQQLAELLDARWKSVRSLAVAERTQWIEAANAAGLADVEERMRKEVLLDQQPHQGGPADEQLRPYVQLERSRFDYAELAQTMDAYARTQPYDARAGSLIEEANAYRNVGDEIAELHVLDGINFEGNVDAGDRERYLQLLLRHDPQRFEAFGASTGNEEIAVAAPNYAVAHGDLKVARAALESRVKIFADPWKNAYSALLGLYFRDLKADTESAFHSVLGDERIVGERINDHTNSNAEETGSPRLAGSVWFYYGMRFGVYRTLFPRTDRGRRDPEDLLPAGLERNSTAGQYVDLACAYADAGETTEALREYRHALELEPDSASIHDSMALLLWNSGKRDEAIARWHEALATLNRLQNRGPAPQSFWGDFARIAGHIGSRNLGAQLHSDMDVVVRGYLARNGNYRSDELLRAAFLATADHGEGVDWILSLAGAGSDPASVLASVDSAEWLPPEAREPLLLREINLARIAAAHVDDNGYAAQRVVQMQKSLVLYYVAQKQDGKAETAIDDLTKEQRQAPDLIAAQIEIAARAHRLDSLLKQYRSDATDSLPAVDLQLLRNAAGKLAAEADVRNALAIWEFVFERGQLSHDLVASDFMGLADARLAAGDVSGAVDILRQMTLLSGDGAIHNELADGGMANYDHAARLLEEKGHSAEALEFLNALAKGVPWDASYRLRLAKARLEAVSNKDAGETLAALASIAGDNSLRYDLRVQAAVALRGEHADVSKIGSEELRLLGLEKVTPPQAEQPYFAAARIASAATVSGNAERALLLLQAAAIDPSGLPDAPGFRSEDLRLQIFRVQTALGHDVSALDAIDPLLSQADAVSNQSVEGNDVETDGGSSAETMNSGEAEAQSGDETVSPPDALKLVHQTLAQLEREAPFPLQGAQTDAEKALLASQIAQAYEHTGRPGRAVHYGRLALRLQKDETIRGSLQGHLDQLELTLTLERRNATRRPVIQRAINQSVLVRPQLSPADLTGTVSGKEAR